MLVTVYEGQQLAAKLEYGRTSLYYGKAGERVKATIESDFYLRNKWTGEVSTGPRLETPEWWASTIFGAGLHVMGFTLYVSGLPQRTRLPRLPLSERLRPFSLTAASLQDAHPEGGRQIA